MHRRRHPQAPEWRLYGLGRSALSERRSSSLLKVLSDEISAVAAAAAVVVGLLYLEVGERSRWYLGFHGCDRRFYHRPIAARAWRFAAWQQRLGVEGLGLFVGVEGG